MNGLTEPAIRLTDCQPEVETFREDFLAGLRRDPKQLPPKYFYDERGSQLFDRICELEEYFPTRTEKAILHEHLEEIRKLAGPQCRVVEYGSGSSDKTRLLLDHLEAPAAYVPIEISREHLLMAAEKLAQRYPDVEILPVCADYTTDYEAPVPDIPHRRSLFFFPGSTLGNFHPDEALRFLRSVADEAEAGDDFLVGIGLQTDRDVLERAYNDKAGVTAEFNLNLLRRARRELGVNLDPDAFAHAAIYDQKNARIEMRLVCNRRQVFELDGETFSIEPEEYIVTEYSHKFTDEGFTRMASRAGFRSERVWSDSQQRFSVHYLRRDEVSKDALWPKPSVVQAACGMR